MYSGIHYDAIALTPSPDAPTSFDQTTFEFHGIDRVLQAVKQLAALWKKKHKYTDTSNFTLKCAICQAGIKGQVEAQNHAKQTGHASFTEYS